MEAVVQPENQGIYRQSVSKTWEPLGAADITAVPSQKGSHPQSINYRLLAHLPAVASTYTVSQRKTGNLRKRGAPKAQVKNDLQSRVRKWLVEICLGICLATKDTRKNLLSPSIEIGSNLSICPYPPNPGFSLDSVAGSFSGVSHRARFRSFLTHILTPFKLSRILTSVPNQLPGRANQIKQLSPEVYLGCISQIWWAAFERHKTAPWAIDVTPRFGEQEQTYRNR